MKNLINKLEAIWFAPMPAVRIQIIRIITGVFCLWYLLTRFTMMDKLSNTNPNLYSPVGTMQFFSTPIPAHWVTAMLIATVVFNIFFILGWKHKYTGPLFALLLLFTFSYRNSWSMVYHSYNLMVIHLFILGFAPAGGWPSKKSKQTRWSFGWPLQLMSMVTLLAYFLAGVAKLKGELAWGWLNGTAMRSQVAVDAIRKNVLGVETSELFATLYPYAWIFTIMGAASLILELIAPAILFCNKKIRVTWVVLVFMMHWGIFFIMGITFNHHLTGILYLSFMAPEKLLDYANAAILSIKNLPKKVTSLTPASTNR